MRLLAGLALVSGITVFAVQSLLMSNVSRHGALILIGAAVLMLALIRAGRLRLSALVMCWSLVAGGLVAAFGARGLMQSSLVALPLAAMIGGWLLGRWSALMVSLAGLAGELCLLMMHEHGYVFPLGATPEVYPRAATVQLTALVVAAIVGIAIADTSRGRLAALARSRSHLSAIMDSTTDLIWSVDCERFGLLEFNHGLRDWYIARDIPLTPGMRPEDLLRGEDVEQWRDFYARALREGVFVVDDFASGGGTIVRLEFRVMLDAGERVGIAVFARNVTAEKQALAELIGHRERLSELVEARTAELVTAKQAAESAAVAKSAFLANMSHEIRTPLNAIIGLTQLMKSAELPPGEAEHLAQLELSADHLLGIVSAVLDLSKLDADKFTLAAAPIALGSVVNDVAVMISDRAKAKGLRVLVECPSDAVCVEGDATRLRQALLNYATNALKFTASGAITLRLGIAPDPGDGEHVLARFEVDDTGIGIAPDALPRLFMAFEQAEAATAQAYGGTGLGLTITRRLAHLMGGEAGCDSTLGRGSRFWFTARLRRCASAAIPSTQHTGDARAALQSDHAGARVLVVEDDPVSRKIAVAYLTAAGLASETAVDGAEAVRCVAESAFDLILMDMNMPVMNGLEATRRIRALPERDAVPIVALTANAFSDDAERCLEAGMNDFLAKPVTPQTLYPKLVQWLDSRRASGSRG